MDGNAPHWSGDVHQADWIGPRLADWDGDYTAAIVVPAGFAAYARVLHPAEIAEDGGRPVRWADVAAWSGMPLRQDAQFHSIALPPTDPGEPPPYQGQGPREGSLYLRDAEVPHRDPAGLDRHAGGLLVLRVGRRWLGHRREPVSATTG